MFYFICLYVQFSFWSILGAGNFQKSDSTSRKNSNVLLTDLWLNIVHIQNLRLKYSSPENNIEKTKWQLSKVRSFFMGHPVYGKYIIKSSIYNQNEKVILRWEEMTS